MKSNISNWINAGLVLFFCVLTISQVFGQNDADINCIQISTDKNLIHFSESLKIYIDAPPFKKEKEILEETFTPYTKLNLYTDPAEKANKRYWLRFRLCNQLETLQNGYLTFGRFDRVFVFDKPLVDISSVQKFGKLYKRHIENKSPDYNLMPLQLEPGEEREFLVHISAGYHMNSHNNEINATYIPWGQELNYLANKPMLFKQGVLFIGILIFIGFLFLGCIVFYFFNPQKSILAFSVICIATLLYFSRGLEIYFQEVIFWSHWDELIQRTEVLFRSFVSTSFLVFILSYFKFYNWKKIVLTTSMISVVIGIVIGLKLYFTIDPYKSFSQLDVVLYLADIFISILNSLFVLSLIWKFKDPDARTFVIGTVLYIVISYAGLALNLNFPGLATTYFSANMLAIYGLLLFLFFMTYLLINRTYQIQFSYEREIIKTEQLNNLSEAKTKLYTNITHELRTPLTIISGLAKRLEEGKQKELIEKNSANLLSMINQILDLSKIESGTITLNADNVDIISYTKVLTNSYASLANEKYISLNFYSEKDELPICIDKSKYKLIVGNIISNAIKYTPKYGKILVLIKKVNDTFLVQIEDTGKGISKTEIESIFERYYQVNSTDSLSTGIGLAIVKELVHLLKGEISVDSQIDKGSCFTLQFPIIEATSDLVSTSPAIKSSINPDNFYLVHNEQNNSTREKSTVLIIEDNYDLIEYLSDILNPHYKILKSLRAEHGLELAKKYVPNIIVSDVMMPGLSGYELCTEIKNDIVTSHIPVMLLTAKADKESKLKGLKTGAAAYLTKPFDEEELLIRIDTILRNIKKSQEHYTQSQNSKLPEKLNKLVDPFLVRVNEIIDKHISNESFGIPILCQELHLERTQVYRKIKAITGKSASVLIQTRRMEKAQQLMKAKQLSVTEIAEKCGFTDPNYFSKVFKKSFGQSPSYFL